MSRIVSSAPVALLFRPKSVRALLEVGLKKRLDDDLYRHLRHSIAHRRDPQRPLGPIWLRNVPPPHWRRSVRARFEVLLPLTQKYVHTPPLDHLQGLPVDAGGPSVALHPLPRLCQDVTPADQVSQRMEAPRPTSLGRHVEPALESSDFFFGVVSGPRDVIATHQARNSVA